MRRLLSDVRRAPGRLRRRARRRWAARAARIRGRDLAAILSAGTLDLDWIARQAGDRLDAPSALRWLAAGAIRDGASPHPLVEPWRAQRLLGPLAHRATLRGEVDAAAAHPLLRPGRTLREALSDPAAAALDGVDLDRWAELVDRAQSVLDDERLVAGPRLLTSWDASADRAYVARWSTEPGPVESGPWVTVVMPVRNRPEAVARAIGSVQRQTLAEWELVVIDDGSTDDTADVVERLAATDPRIRLLRRAHLGVCAARNAGIDAATTPYVAFLDSDNEWTPEFLRTAVAALHAQGGAVGHAVLDEQSDGGHRYRAFDGQERHLRTGNFVDLNVLVVRADALRDIGGFDTSLRRMVDYDLVWRLAKRHRLVLLPFVGVHYAAHSHLSDRISATESFGWNDVVKARNLVAHQPLPAQQRDDALLSVVVPHRGLCTVASDTVRAILAADLGRLEVVVVDLASGAPDWRMLHAEQLLDERVHLVRSPTPLNRAAATLLGVARTGGSRLLVIPTGVVPEPAALSSLVGALADSPLVMSEDRGSGVLAARAGDYLTLDGLDRLFTDELELDDLQRRAEQRGIGVATVAVAVGVEVPWREPSPQRRQDNAREWQRRWGPGSGVEAS